MWPSQGMGFHLEWLWGRCWNASAPRRRGGFLRGKNVSMFDGSLTWGSCDGRDICQWLCFWRHACAGNLQDTNKRLLVKGWTKPIKAPKITPSTILKAHFSTACHNTPRPLGYPNLHCAGHWLVTALRQREKTTWQVASLENLSKHTFSAALPT